jgi:predicted ATPase
MPWSQPIENALGLPAGAQFYRCALQVNPSHYAATYRGLTHALADDQYIERLVATAVEQGIQVMAITDHNHVGSVERIAEEGASKGIVVFPGFEIRSKEGVHFICIFPFGTSIPRLERYLGAMGIHELKPSDALSAMDCGAIPQYVAEQGGIVIAAHVTGNGGLLKVLEGKPCIAAWRNKDLLAVQIPGAIDSLEHNHKRIIRNLDPEYKRKPPSTGGLALAVVNARDVVTPEDLSDPYCSCQIKMTTPSVEGLRQAFLDPESRIRLNHDERLHSEFEFIALTWQGGFLDGIGLHFNDNLNVLIGGRGTGKSTVVESLRYVLGLNALGSDAHRAHEGVVMQVLMTGTKVSLLVRSRFPSPAEYLIERTVPGPAIVRDIDGQVKQFNPVDVLPGVEVYGQHEMSELTRSPEKLTHLLFRFLELDENHEQRRNGFRLELSRNRAAILQAVADLNRLEERLSALPRLEEEARRYEEAGVEARLKEASQLVVEDSKLTQVAERLAAFDRPLTQLSNLLPVELAFLADEEIHQLPGASHLLEARELLLDAEVRISAAQAEVRAVVETARPRLDGIRQRWLAHKADIERAYNRVLRQLQKDKIDGGDFIRVRRGIEDLKPLTKRRVELANRISELRRVRAQSLADWKDLVSTETREIQRAARKVNKRLENVVRVSLTPAGDREPLFNFLRENVGGQLKTTLEKLRVAEDLTLTELAKACRGGPAELAERYGLVGAAAERMCGAPEDVLLKLEELELPHTTSIELNVAGEGQAPAWRGLHQLSTGQKATAILLLLLLESDAPLVVDQPEDDLDNRFITDGIVPKLREAKRRRQFILTTHNANIPVLGDAEQIIALVGESADGENRISIPADNVGAIDAPKVREMVELVLEGGREAFESRRRKYGF